MPESPTPYLVMMLVGFAIGIYGHMLKSRFVVAIGIALVFLATALLPLAAFIARDDPPPQPPPTPPIAFVEPLAR